MKGYACSGTSSPLKLQAVHRPLPQQPETQQNQLVIQAVHQPQQPNQKKNQLLENHQNELLENYQNQPTRKPTKPTESSTNDQQNQPANPKTTNYKANKETD